MKRHATRPRSYQLAVMTIAVSAIVGCAKRADQVAGSSSTVQSKDSIGSGMTATRTMSDSDAMHAQSAASAPDQMTSNMRMSDSELAEFILTVDRGEVEAGQLALSKAKSGDVKTYGQSMIAAHRADLATVQRIGSAMTSGMKDGAMNGATVRDSATAKLVEMHIRVMGELGTATGDTFDRMYIDAMARGHQFVLNTLKSATMYNGTSRIAAHATTLIAVVDEHLRRAMALQGLWER